LTKGECIDFKSLSQIKQKTFCMAVFFSGEFLKLTDCNVFSSPELKAQVSYSDRPLSAVRLSVRLSVNFYIFDFFSRTTGPILTRLGTNHPWGKGIQVCSNEGNSRSPRGDNCERVKIH
jgi:hypothetical protein